MLGEHGSSWHEMEEVACHYRNEDDGLMYYVGDKDGTPLGPDFKETVEALKWNKENNIPNVPYEVRANHIIALILGRNPKEWTLYGSH